MEEATTGEDQHLVAHPDNWRRQLWLRGRHMAVGRLVAWMNANQMDAAAVAEDFDLPLAQVHEALAYFETHRDLVNAELRSEKAYLQEKGYAVEPLSMRQRPR